MLLTINALIPLIGSIPDHLEFNIISLCAMLTYMSRRPTNITHFEVMMY